jgi:hypothetical protein
MKIPPTGNQKKNKPIATPTSIAYRQNQAIKANTTSQFQQPITAKKLSFNQIKELNAAMSGIRIEGPKKSAETTSISEIRIENAEYTIADIEKLLKKYAEQLAVDGKKILEISFSALQIEAKEKDVFVLKSPHAHLDQTLKTEIDFFKAQVHKSLKNNQITFLLEFDDASHEYKTYKPDEAFKEMMAINPALAMLQQNFDLDIEF